MAGRERLFRLDTYPTKHGTRPSPMSLALEDFYTLLAHEEVDCVPEEGKTGCRGKKCPQKDGLAWTAGFIDTPCKCGSDALPDPEKRERPGYCPQCKARLRFAPNVTGLDFAVFDIDHITEQQRDAMLVQIDGVELCLHTTHSHKPPDDQNFRLVFPLARTITPAEWKQLWHAIVRKFHLPEAKLHGVDKKARDPARLAFFPRAPRGNPIINIHQEGALLDPDDLLLEGLAQSRETVTGVRAPIEPGSVNLKDLRSRLNGYEPDDDFDGEKKEIVRRIRDEEALAEKGARGSTTLRAGSIVGWRFPIGTPVEAALEILRPSISKMEILEGDDPDENSVEAWLNQVRRGYTNGQEGQEARAIDAGDTSGKILALMKRKAAEKAAKATPMPTFGRAAPLGPPLMGDTPRASAPTPHFPIPATPDEDGDPDGDWRLKLIVTVDKQGVPHPKNTFANIVETLKKHRAWQGVFRYNEVTNEPEAVNGPLSKGDRDPDALVTATRLWLSQKEGYEQPYTEVLEAVGHLSRKNRYDPVRAYLTEKCIPSYDGKPRMRNWLIDYCGARLEDDNGLDVTEYVKMVGEKWLMAAAARALYPGCKADNVLVFEGEQFAGKSSALDILGGEWFAENPLSLDDHTTRELTAKSWIIELSELSSMKKSETDKQKSFFSTRVDHFRLKYERRAKAYKRRCVFAGTTNETKYLLDLTGNRRFWCVWCLLFDLFALKRDRDQIWAEAAIKVLAGETCPNCSGITERCSEHRWWLNAQQTELAEQVAVTRLRADFADEIRAWWFARVKKPAHLTTKSVLVDILGLTTEKKDQHQVAIGRAMKTLGFQHERVRVPGGREWVYVPYGDLLLGPPPAAPAKFDREKVLSDLAAAAAPKERQ